MTDAKESETNMKSGSSSMAALGMAAAPPRMGRP